MNHRKFRNRVNGVIRLKHHNQKVSGTAIGFHRPTAGCQSVHRKIDGILADQLSCNRNTVSPMSLCEIYSQQANRKESSWTQRVKDAGKSECYFVMKQIG